jgi:hypothetical protein
MSFLSIRAKIKEKLDSLTSADGSKPLRYSYDFNKTIVQGYPSAVFEPSDNTSDYSSTADNLRTYGFTIRILQEIELSEKDGSIDILGDVLEQILNAFDTDWSLGGVCVNVEALPSKWGISPDMKVRIAEINIRCRELYDLGD